MKCQECSYDNLPHSDFCQNCGFSLKKHPHKEDESPVSSIRQEIEKIDDVIFKPKKNGSFIGKALKLFFVIAGIGFVGLVGLIFLIAVFDSETPSTSNADSIETDSTTFPIGYLEIQDLDSDWVGQQFYISGVLKNSYSLGAKDISVRVDFYKDENEEELFDTRYITILGVIANGAYSFEEPVYINPYDGRFWYVTQIESADYIQ